MNNSPTWTELPQFMIKQFSYWLISSNYNSYHSRGFPQNLPDIFISKGGFPIFISLKWTFASLTKHWLWFLLSQECSKYLLLLCHQKPNTNNFLCFGLFPRFQPPTEMMNCQWTTSLLNINVSRFLKHYHLFRNFTSSATDKSKVTSLDSNHCLIKE